MTNAKSKKKSALRELTAGDLEKICAGIVALGNPPPSEPVRPG